jgi:diguanylate cyclase (GGDEF)-like protein
MSDDHRNKRALSRSARQLILGVFLLAFAAGVTLSALVWMHGRAAQAGLQVLQSETLPTLERISRLKADVVALEPAAYRLALVHPPPINEVRVLRERIRSDLKALAAQPQLTGGILTATRSFSDIEWHLNELDEALRDHGARSPAIDDLVGRIGQSCSLIIGQLDRLQQDVELHAAAKLESAALNSQLVTGIVAGFSLLLLAVVAVGGFLARAWIGASAEMHRLSTFPARNPNPVLSLTASGRLEYANTAAYRLLARLAPDGSPLALLPDDFYRRLPTLKAAESARWEYRRFGREFGCGIHYLGDYDVLHAYVSDITDRKRAEEQLVHQSYHDALTGLPNRLQFRERLTESLTGNGALRAAILLLAPDRSQSWHETLGLSEHDLLIQSLASRIEQVLATCRDDCGNAQLYRFDDERFAVLMESPPDDDSPARVFGALRTALATPFEVNSRALHVALSGGASVFPSDGGGVEALVIAAESALHQAQQAGGDDFRFYSPQMNARAGEMLELENDLRYAVARGEMRLYYQPQICLQSGRIVGAEALVRWQHPTRGLVPPGDFIPLAESTGLINEIGTWVVGEAVRQNAAWRREGLTPIAVAVNLSARRFRTGTIEGVVRDALAVAALPADALELEVTESVAMHDVESTIATMTALKAIGVQLSIDDFGTGYSSLSYLKRFPLDKLKIDQSFIRALAPDGADAAIVRSIIALADALGLSTIAEGVETENQRALLHAWSCREIQGYLISRPVPANKLAALLAGNPAVDVDDGHCPAPATGTLLAAGRS